VRKAILVLLGLALCGSIGVAQESASSLGLRAGNDPELDERLGINSGLLLPFFEVDTTTGGGTTTLWAVRNVSDVSSASFVVRYFGDDGFEIDTESFTLAPQATKTRNMRDLGFTPGGDGFVRGFAVFDVAMNTTVDFEGVAPPGGETRFDPTYTESGFAFTGATDFRVLNNLPGQDLYNGTAMGYVQNPPEFTVTRTDGEPFTLRQFEGGQAFDDPAGFIVLKGTFVDGREITASFPTLTNVFTTYSLPSQWRDLVSVEFVNGKNFLGIDNFVLSRDNQLVGDVINVVPGEDFARGEQMPYFVPGSANDDDFCFTWDMRFLSGGAFSGGTSITYIANFVGGTTSPTITFRLYDESGAFLGTSEFFTSLLVGRIPVEDLLADIGSSESFGAIRAEFSDAPGKGGYISWEANAEGLYSIGLPAACVQETGP